MDRVPVGAHQREGRPPRPLHPAAHARRGAPQRGAAAPGVHDPLRQHDPRRPGALLPRRRGDGAPVPALDPLERRRPGDARPAPRGEGRRAHLVLRLGVHPLRGGPQPLLPRQGPPRRRRPRVLPGARLPRPLRAGLPGGAPVPGGDGRLPPAGLHPPRPALLPAPPPAARLLGVPHGLPRPGPRRGHLPGVVRPLPALGRPQGHLPAAHVGVPRRRRDGRARVAGHAAAGRPAAPGQPHLRHQLQPAAPRRAGARQRQDHPGARSLLQGRRVERHQGHLGARLGPAARS